MRTKLFAVALAVAASPVAAMQPVTITSTGIYNPGTLLATVDGSTKSEYATALTFTASSGGKPAFDALGFCVDLPHEIYVAIGTQLKQTLAYHVAPLTSDGYGNPLSSVQIHEMTGLARLGFGIAKGTAADKSAQLAGIQQAIWTVEYPTSTFVATGPYAAAQTAYAAAFVHQAPTLTGFARAIVADNGATQAQLTTVGGVPEPAVWAEMLAGFAVVGMLSRRRHGMAAVAA